MIPDSRSPDRGPDRASPPDEARRRLRSPEVREHLDRLPLQTDPAELAELLAAAAREAVRAERARCRLGEPAEADGATGASGRRIAAPLIEPGGEVLGELVAERAEPFGDAEIAALEALARHGAALLVILPPARLEAESGADGRSEVHPSPPSGRTPSTAPAPGGRGAVPEPQGRAEPPDLAHLKRGAADLFRREALESLRGSDEHGKPLELAPGWLRWAFRLLLAGLVACCLVLATTDVTEHAAGPAEVVAAGDGGAARARVVLPGAAGARVAPGMEGRLRLDELPERELPIRVVSVRPAGPASAPRVVAEVETTDRSIEVAGGGVPLRAGLRGTAEISVGREPILHALLPGLRSLGEGDDG